VREIVVKITDLKDNRFIRKDGKPETEKQRYFFEQYYSLPPNERNPTKLRKVTLKAYEADQKKPKKEREGLYKPPNVQHLYKYKRDCCWDERVADRNYEAYDKIKDEAIDYTRYMYQTNKDIHMSTVNFNKALINLNNLLMGELLITNPSEEEKYKYLVELQTKLGYLLVTVSNHQFTGTSKINHDLEDLDKWIEFKEQLQSHHNLYSCSEDYLEETIQVIDDSFKLFYGDE
jgi:hypothetical protein